MKKLGHYTNLTMPTWRQHQQMHLPAASTSCHPFACRRTRAHFKSHFKAMSYLPSVSKKNTAVSSTQHLKFEWAHFLGSLRHAGPPALQEFELSVLQRPIKRMDIYVNLFECVWGFVNPKDDSWPEELAERARASSGGSTIQWDKLAHGFMLNKWNKGYTRCPTECLNSTL